MALAAVLPVLAGAAPSPTPQEAPTPAKESEAPAIDHHRVTCLVAGRFPQLDACFVPADRVARARVYFRAVGQASWYYVDMKPEAGCYRGTLPRPKKTLGGVDYYVAVTGIDFTSAETEEYRTAVVADPKGCEDGNAAPYVTSASVVVGGLAGALPAGFAAGGAVAGLGTAAVVAGVVGAGAGVTAITVGGGEEGGSSSTTTTTVPTATPTTTTTTTTTTVPTGCAADSAPPDVSFRTPVDGADVGARIDIEVEAADPGPVSNGIVEVRLYAEEQGGSRTAAIATLPGPGPLFAASWSLPPCLGPSDRWYLLAEAVDGCERTSVAQIRVKRRFDTCAPPAPSASTSARRRDAPPPDAPPPDAPAPDAPAPDAPAPDASAPDAPAVGPGVILWTSELAVPQGRGQVVGNGAEVVFPEAGRSELRLAARPGRNRVEATLVTGAAPGGTWQFRVEAGAVVPSSLRVVAGEAVFLGAGHVSFRLKGRPGERVVFTYDAE